MAQAVPAGGGGDVQWVTAGEGIVHSEMFPLLKTDEANPLELFQIWLNLPARSKMVEPYFTMFWSDAIPRVTQLDANGLGTEVTVVAGRLPTAPQVVPLAPPPNSRAAQADADLAIWTVTMAPGARWTLPAAAGKGTRTVASYDEDGLTHEEFTGYGATTRTLRQFLQHSPADLLAELIPVAVH